MTDFVARVLRPEREDWIVRSLLDVDFYKFTMGFFIFRHYRGTNVKFSLINRNKKIPLARVVNRAELCRQLDHVRGLMLNSTDIAYLRGMRVYGENMFPEEYYTFLERLRLTPYTIEQEGDQYRLCFEGPWEVVTFWETIALAIICELFYRKLMESMSETDLRVLFARATDKLYCKLQRIKSRPSIVFADFGQRRRFAFLWQLFAIKMAHEMLGKQFTGTSNTWMAFNQSLMPIGTNAHELPMVLTALAKTWDDKRQAQYNVLRLWQETFPMGGLRIVLADTYGTRQFFENMPQDLAEDVARNWRGFRGDSGDPVAGALFVIDWYKQFGIDPIQDGKVFIPSDGLDVDSMLAIDDALAGKIAHPFGWGTMFTNDFIDCHPRSDDEAVVSGERLGLSNRELFRGHSFVCKVESANNKPAVKISDNPNKATGQPDVVVQYLREFGTKGLLSQEVLV